MPEPVNTRAYRSPARREAARRTRQAILAAARRLFAERGYAATTMAAVAADAGVALDTVYAAVGAKPVLFRLLLETALSGIDEVVPAEERDYVKQIRSAPQAADKIAIYAGAVRAIGQRMAPLHLVLREAAAAAPELAQIRDEISRRRAANMRLFAADLAATGQLRPGLGVEEVADVVWATSSADLYALLVGQRRWAPERFERWLADSWSLLFLADPGVRG